MAGSLTFRKLSVEDFADLPDDSRELVKRLAEPLNQALASVATALSGGLTVKQNLAAQVKVVEFTTAAQWIRPTFTNAWTDASGSRFIRYRKDGYGRVTLEGRMQSGVVNSPAFTLPADYRPGQELKFATNSNSAYGAATVATTGEVTLTNGSNLAADMNFSFVTADPDPGPTLASPILFKNELRGAPLGLFLVRCFRTDRKDQVPPVSLPAWRLVDRGGVSHFHIDHLLGLKPERNYTATLVALSE